MTKTKNPHLTGAFDLFSKSTEVVKRNLTLFAILYAIPFLTLIGRFGLHPSSRRTSDRFSASGGIAGLPTSAIVGLVSFGFLISVALIVLSFFIRAMTYSLELEGAQNKTPSFKYVFDKASRYWVRLIGLMIIVGVMALVGFILLIVPGLIVIRRYFLAPYLLIDKDLTITEAMQQSAELTKPYASTIWTIIGVSILISLTNVIPFIGVFIAFVLGILYSVAPALRYEELKKLHHQAKEKTA
ncbi:MAG: hypothetical protein JWS12_670 [Candidatus Saccharibacteria bacterium]|nr:hypothetical protein [Candidatus Saccharibacteria bacterium]